MIWRNQKENKNYKPLPFLLKQKSKKQSVKKLESSIRGSEVEFQKDEDSEEGRCKVLG